MHHIARGAVLGAALAAALPALSAPTAPEKGLRAGARPSAAEQPPARRTARPLTDIEPLEGSWNVRQETAIAGRVFERAGWMNARAALSGPRTGRGSAVFSNRERWDLLEAWVGVREGGRGTLAFAVLADGEELFRSPRMGPGDPPVRVSVPIAGRSGITLVAEGEGASHESAAWADPVLVRLPAAIPAPVSPGPGERLSGDFPLVWKGVDGATGYLLELQCERPAGPQRAAGARRFLALELPPGTAVWQFRPAEMQRGRWRWRVHSLSAAGFLGEAEEWRRFESR